MKQTSFKFWGTRGSCPVSGASFQKYGGNTPCVEIAQGGTRLILDGGTGLRPLGEKISQNPPADIHLVLSHMHWDHVMGIPFFEPLYIQGTRLHIWGPEEHNQTLKEIFQELFLEEFFPVRLGEVKAELCFHPVETGQTLDFSPFTLRTHAAKHPGHALCFKIEWGDQKIGYATDNELFQGHVEGPIPEALWEREQSLLDFFSDCTALIHEAQYFSEEYKRRSGWGHSSMEHTAALVEKLQVGAWYVIHHDPKHTDADLDRLQEKARAFFKERKKPICLNWLGDGSKLIF